MIASAGPIRSEARHMRIHSIEAIAIDIPLANNFGGSAYPVRKRSTVISRGPGEALVRRYRVT